MTTSMKIDMTSMVPLWEPIRAPLVGTNHSHLFNLLFPLLIVTLPKNYLILRVLIILIYQ